MGISLNQLKPQNHTVHDIQSHGHIHIQLFLKHQGRNVHAPCGGSCPHHYTDPPAYEQPRIEHCHQLLFQHKATKSASLHHPQQNRVDNGAEYGCQGKLFTQHPCPQQKHGIPTVWEANRASPVVPPVMRPFGTMNSTTAAAYIIFPTKISPRLNTILAVVFFFSMILVLSHCTGMNSQIKRRQISLPS